MDVDNKNYYQEDGKANRVNTYASSFAPGSNRAERRKFKMPIPSCKFCGKEVKETHWPAKNRKSYYADAHRACVAKQTFET